MDINQQINKLVEELMADRATQDLDSLVENARKLSGLSLNLATAVGDYHAARNDAEYMYKTSVDSHVINNKEGAISLKEKIAKDANKEIWKMWVNAENKYVSMKLKLAQVNAILDQIRQTVAYLREEKKHG